MKFLERLIEMFIGEGIITVSELEQAIAEEREKSPIIPLQDSAAFLMYDSMAKEYQFQSLEQQNADIMYTFMMGGM